MTLSSDAETASCTGPSGVTQGVVHQGGKTLLQPIGISRECAGRSAFNRRRQLQPIRRQSPAGAQTPPAATPRDRDHPQPRRVARHRLRARSSITADQLPQALGFSRDQGQLGLALRRGSSSLQALGMAGDHGDRRAQFMGNAIHKATFPLPCLRQACLQLVEGLNNRLQFAGTAPTGSIIRSPRESALQLREFTG